MIVLGVCIASTDFRIREKKILKRSLMSLAGGQPEFLKPQFRKSLLERNSLSEEMKIPESLLDDVTSSAEEEGSQQGFSSEQSSESKNAPGKFSLETGTNYAPSSSTSSRFIQDTASSGINQTMVTIQEENDEEAPYSDDDSPHSLRVSQENERCSGRLGSIDSENSVTSTSDLEDQSRFKSIHLQSPPFVRSFAKRHSSSLINSAGASETETPKLVMPVTDTQVRKRVPTPEFGNEAGTGVKRRRTSPEFEARPPSPPFEDCVDSWRSPSAQESTTEMRPQNPPEAVRPVFPNPTDINIIDAFLPSLRSPVKAAKDLPSPLKKGVQSNSAASSLDLSLISQPEMAQQVYAPDALITPKTRIPELPKSCRNRQATPYTTRMLKSGDGLRSLFKFIGLRELIVDIDRAEAELKARRIAESTEPQHWKSNLQELMDHNAALLHEITTNVSAVLASEMIEQQAAIYSEKLSHLIDSCDLDHVESKLDELLTEGVGIHEGDRDAALAKISDSLKSRIYLLEFDLEKWWKRNFNKQIVDRTISLTNAHLKVNEEIIGRLFFCGCLNQIGVFRIYMEHYVVYQNS
eukprot:Gregarina_sp_Poly_1__4099@NODE_2249_length_2411_cov_119_109215_g1428_i1_p1_GENE_NODE_2249_length_2411_cov_119_109215_g1428_i1NODE_2249_length_2411_cov_119_109215_g1428_i1_p1_ORF_typecomplete_len579_score105_80Spore_YunB/PF09560_10/0_22_NODE_2249_length_2411_cov_119_109215_g1428_i15372273